MYSAETRDAHLTQFIQELQNNVNVEGVVQLGSGVNGYQDIYSDIDLMVASSTHISSTDVKEELATYFSTLDHIIVKEKKFSSDMFLLIVILKNGLEFNVSIVPLEKLTVRSPLWRVILDKDDRVLAKMTKEDELFQNQETPYRFHIDPSFEFFYLSHALEKELKRNNFIYALNMLEELRSLTLLVQTLKEEKKAHQFKAYHTLQPLFVQSYLDAFPHTIDTTSIRASREKIQMLFLQSMQDHPQFLKNETLLCSFTL